MAIDNSLYDSLENAYVKIQSYLNNRQLGREHSEMIVKNEELGELLERLDIEAIEEQHKDIDALHAILNDIKDDSKKVIEDLNGSDTTVTNVVAGLNTIFSKINEVIV
ncbi:hypothetical protein N9A28_04000 [Sulfurimonas sp.]|nr:hypothetical protein [Sulfurimonas sp.]